MPPSETELARASVVNELERLVTVARGISSLRALRALCRALTSLREAALAFHDAAPPEVRSRQRRHPPRLPRS